MHSRDRWQLIIDNLTPDRVVSVDELCAKLDASPATVRRDLTELHRLGSVRRVRGGVLPADTPTFAQARTLQGQLAVSPTDMENSEAKAAIGQFAVNMCKEGDSIIIGGGTTTYMMACQLPDRPFDVMTNSLIILDSLLSKPNVRITLPGGQVFREQSVILNPYEDSIVEKFSASTVFMGAQAISKRGLMQTDPLLVQYEHRLIERADKIVVLADSTKFDAKASLSVCPLKSIDLIITDSKIKKSDRTQMKKAGVQLSVV